GRDGAEGHVNSSGKDQQRHAQAAEESKAVGGLHVQAGAKRGGRGHERDSRRRPERFCRRDGFIWGDHELEYGQDPVTGTVKEERWTPSPWNALSWHGTPWPGRCSTTPGTPCWSSI